MEDERPDTCCVSEGQTQVRRASLRRPSVGFSLLLFIVNGKLQ